MSEGAREANERIWHEQLIGRLDRIIALLEGKGNSTAPPTPNMVFCTCQRTANGLVATTAVCPLHGSNPR